METERTVRTDGGHAAAMPERVGGAPPWMRDGLERIESDERLDVVADRLGDVSAPLAQGAIGAALRGEWLGHALHPSMTDIPIGFWTSSAVLDMVGGKQSRGASRRLIAMGVLTALPTAAAGLAELATIEDRRLRRVAALHAAGNTVALACYAASWRTRRHQHHFRGMVTAALGGTIATFTGYLGGHLSFGRGVGTGARGIDELDRSDAAAARTNASPTDAPRTFGEGAVTSGTTAGAGSVAGSGAEVRGAGSAHLIGIEEAARELTMPVAQVRTLMDQGLLDPVGTDPVRFRIEDVEAVRLQGG